MMSREKGRRLAVLAGVVAGGLALSAGACAVPGDAPSGVSATPAPRAGARSCGADPPGLSRLGASVQAQIRERQQAVTDPDAAVAGGLDARGALGMLLMAASLPEAAEDCFHEASARAPDDPRWPYYLGHLGREVGALEDAAAFFEAVLRIRPNDLPALVWLGDVRLEQGRPVFARPFFEQALALRPDSLSARYGLGRAALLAEDYQRAVGLLEDVLARDPAAAAAHYPLGMAYRALGKRRPGRGPPAPAEEHGAAPDGSAAG